ncbi:hypothetical protein M404DRAFT_1004572 [Pisolithus tinctorius Marx 270]|uniref:Uncharacterized protein n=1 Tax=Pisolithus tinctorius Marx 270 TaxID=870435 RepID=A0A0C3NWQ0_PISTI|nr:hypothetical protein M404DRAFT_1004572 [Pisolithus tinctorius Marx 270]
MRLPVFARCDDKLFDARLAIAYRAGSRGLFGKTVATAYLRSHKRAQGHNGLLHITGFKVVACFAFRKVSKSCKCNFH